MPTTARGIWTPSDTDAVDFTTHLATMAGTIDTAITNGLNTIGAGANAFKGTAAQRAAFLSTAVNGMLWQDTDSIKMIWRKDGAAWVPAVWHWSGTTAQMNAFAAPNGFEWFNTTDNSDYVRRNGNWYKEFIISSASYSGPNISGPNMFVQAGITGARPGALAKIEWSTFGIFNSSSATTVNSSVMVSTNGLPPTASSQILVPLRAYTPAAGSVNSNPGGVTAFTVPATGNINAGLYITSSMLYGADGGTITVSVHN